MCLKVDSQGRWMRQATICRESGAVDHRRSRQGPMSSLSQCHTVIAFARPPNGATRLCDLVLGPTGAARQQGHGRRRMFQQRWRHLKDANIEIYRPHVAKRAASPPIAASCASGIDPLHRSLLSISPLILLSAAAAEGTVSRETMTGEKCSLIQRRKSWYHGNSRRETSLLGTKQSGRKSEVASADRFGSRALEGERRCTSRSLGLCLSSPILPSFASRYQNQYFPAISHLSTYPCAAILQSASTRPVVFTRCGLSACIPRPPRVHLITYTTATATARPRGGGAMLTKKPTYQAASRVLPTLTISPPLPPRYVLNTCIQTTVYPGLDKETETAGHESRVAATCIAQPAEFRLSHSIIMTSSSPQAGLVFRPTLPGRVGPDMHDLQIPCHHHLQTTGERHICQHLSHLLSAGTASRFQNTPPTSGAGLRMAADGACCHVKTRASPLLRAPELTLLIAQLIQCPGLCLPYSDMGRRVHVITTSRSMRTMHAHLGPTSYGTCLRTTSELRSHLPSLYSSNPSFAFRLRWSLVCGPADICMRKTNQTTCVSMAALRG
jgi:hypothetical protein